MTTNITPNWWRDKLIEAFESFWWKVENKELKQYFLDNYSDYIFRSVQKSNLDKSINWQLQYYSKKDWGNNYKNKYDLFYKIKSWLWGLNKNYEKEIDKFNDFKETKILFYKWNNWDLKINVFLKNETIWITQEKLAELFWVDRTVITKHLKNIFESWELEKITNVQKMHFNNYDSRMTNYYNLDAIIAVWYRVNSKQATQFRIWATSVLKEFVIKGFVMDDERLKNWDKFWKKYFEELLERIRDIRTSERMFYQKLTDLYSLSADYDKGNETTKQFFATIQNKLHFAISWNTASEIIYDRVDSEKENMWLTSWKTSPKWKIMKSDVSIAKNYLAEKEIKTLNLLVNAYLDIAEVYTIDEEIMTMKDWKERIDDFLKWARKNILQNAWKISAKLSKQKAEKEYDKFKPKQDLLYKNDFDELLEEVKQKKLK